MLCHKKAQRHKINHGDFVPLCFFVAQLVLAGLVARFQDLAQLHAGFVQL